MWHVNRTFKRLKPQPLLLVAALLLSGYTGAWLESRHEQGAANNLSTQKKIVTSQSQLISQIAKTVGPSVVSIDVSITSNGNDIFGLPVSQQAGAAGTGIIISESGLIVTNRHVVPEGTTNVDVSLSDGTVLKDVSVIGRTPGNDSLDVAFLKINDLKGHKLTAASLGDSSKIQVGDDVVAIGNALGQFQNTVTSGIISGYGRSVTAGDSSGSSAESLDNLFQTDAAINEGNSGGPLVNLNGQVIGINTAVAGDAQNIGFAIPIDDIKGLIGQVIKTGKFSKPYLGVRYVMLSQEIAAQYKLKVKEGAFIIPSEDAASSTVVPESPAAKAGLKEGDVITQIDGNKVDKTHSLSSQLGKLKPGDKVTLTIVRDGKAQKKDIKLGSAPADQ
jgi:S1-C subfamily serine protease